MSQTILPLPGDYDYPKWFSDCQVSPKEGMSKVVVSGSGMASGFATNEPHTFYEQLWPYIQAEDIRDFNIRQALFMAPHKICLGETFSAKGWFPKSVSAKFHAISQKLDGLGKLVEHYKELQERKITFTTPFIGATLSPVIPSMAITRALYPDFVGRNTTRMGITDMQSIHFPEAVESMAYDPDGIPMVDSFVAVMTPPDEKGELSHGPANGANGEIVDLILENTSVNLLLYINGGYPFTRGYGDAPNTVPIERFRKLAEAGRLFVVADEGKLPSAPADSFSNPSKAEQAIAENLLNHIEENKHITNGRAIQVGIGRTGVQAIRMLKDSSWSGRIYTEMLEPYTLELMEAGKIAGTHFIESDGRRTQLDGKLVCTFTMCEDGQDFYGKLHNNSSVIISPASRVVVPEGFYGGMGINNCLGIDFQGHINAGGKDKNHHSGVGGQAMIVRGLAKGGIAYLCMKSTHRAPTGKLRSSVFPFLPRGTPISLIGPDLMGGRSGGRIYLVTEQGVTKLSGRSQSHFVRNIIDVAHPRFRPWLKKQAWKEFRIKS